MVGNVYLSFASLNIISPWKNVEPHNSTILEDEKPNSFWLERAWQVLQKTHI